MKTYDQLTKEQQDLAAKRIFNMMQNELLAGDITFPGTELQAQIDSVRQRCQFTASEFGNRVLIKCGEKLLELCHERAKDGLYPERTDLVLMGIA